MKLSDFKFELHDRYIAQYPLEKRDHSRLMVLDRKKKSISHDYFYNIVNYFSEGDCLVVNETRVFPARLLGTKDKTDAKVEIFLLRELETDLWEVLVKPARKVRVGNRLSINNLLFCDVIDNTISGGRVVRCSYEGEFYEIVEKIGKAPLPPYITRESELQDKECYQTVYATRRGSVAAPTSGLHFTPELLEKVKEKGIKIVPILLHLGLGGFRQVLVEDLSRHKMDSEYFDVSQQAVDLINETRRNKKKIIAVGTSTVRGLESAITSEGWAKAGSGWTDKFIYPPYEFHVIDNLITNFHLSCTTLLMLASAFAGRDFLREAYEVARQENYRFASYGDAMLIL
ncbi:tRNA preQ1(34) S-adenosylmethionine ribosyltransferase-isomerase QueA [candidate division KSB1 bacterium]|nr:tRNA preQ1(34) S-adenosylmethionine ribosyltransferase-isomerase QueA [candidate division KSB1 bacterium]